MSRTYKDKPYAYGGDRHKYYCVNNHSSHSKFVRLMSRLRRRELDRSFKLDADHAITKSPREKEYFD